MFFFFLIYIADCLFGYGLQKQLKPWLIAHVECWYYLFLAFTAFPPMSSSSVYQLQEKRSFNRQMWSCISSTLHYCPIFCLAFGLRLLYIEIHITYYALTSFWLSLWLKYYHFTIIHLLILYNFYSRWIYYFSVCNVMIFIPFLGEIICIASGAGIIYLLSPIHLKLFLLAFNILFFSLFHLMRFLH